MSVADEVEIDALLSRYCRAVDSQDWASYRALFTEDARVGYFHGRWRDELVRTTAGWRIRALKLEVAS